MEPEGSEEPTKFRTCESGKYLWFACSKILTNLKSFSSNRPVGYRLNEDLHSQCAQAKCKHPLETAAHGGVRGRCSDRRDSEGILGNSYGGRRRGIDSAGVTGGVDARSWY